MNVNSFISVMRLWSCTTCSVTTRIIAVRSVHTKVFLFCSRLSVLPVFSLPFFAWVDIVSTEVYQQHVC